MTEEDFASLRAPLQQLNPTIEEFCRKNGFERIEGPSVGRYPRVRLQRSDSITLWFDLWMGLDAEGERFSRVSPEIPYELSAGAFFDEQSGSAGRWRYQKSFVIWPSIPFHEIAEKLSEALEDGLKTLERWDLSLLQKEGLRVPLE